MKIVYYLLGLSVILLAFQNCDNGFKAMTATQLPSSSSLNLNSAFDSQSLTFEINRLTPNLISPCTIPEYQKWTCLKETVLSKEGKPYQILFRWNLSQKVPNGVILWAYGGNGSGSYRSDREGAQVQDDFESQGIRSIEILALDPEGYFVHAGGYRSSSAALVSAVERASRLGILNGSWLNYVGGSAATAHMAYALSHYKIEPKIDRVVFNAGPFFPNINKNCDANYWNPLTQFPKEIQLGVHRMLTKALVGVSSDDLCQLPNREDLSTFNGPIQIFYQTAVHIIVGEKERIVLDSNGRVIGYGQFLIDSSFDYFSQVVAAEKTYSVRPDIGHEMSWSDIRKFAGLAPPKMLNLQVPTIKFAWSPDGLNQSRFPIGPTAYGLVNNVSMSAVTCGERVGSQHCENPYNWKAPIPSEWTFSSGQWRGVVPTSPFKAGDSFYTYWRNVQTGETSARHFAEFFQPRSENPDGALKPKVLYSKISGGPRATDFLIGPRVHGRVEGLGPKNALTCGEIEGTMRCQNEANFAAPDSTWRYENSVWIGNIPTEKFKGGQRWRTYWRNSQTSQTSEGELSVIISPSYTISQSPGGTPSPTIRKGSFGYAKVVSMPADNVVICGELTGTNSCQNAIWSPPDAVWSYQDGTWSASLATGAFNPGQRWTLYFRNNHTGETTSTQVEITN